MAYCDNGKSIRRILPAAILLFIIQGCGPKAMQINTANRAQVRENAVYGIHYSPPAFIPMTAGKAMTAASFGLIGGAITEAALEKKGKRMVAEYQMKDPAQRVKSIFLNDLSSNGSITAYQPLGYEYKSDDMEYLKLGFNQGYVVDFKTLHWGFIYYGTDWNRYHMRYGLRARIVEFPAAEILWQGVCEIVEDEPPEQRPSLDELNADNGAEIKRRLDKAADVCSKQLAEQYAQSKKLSG